jgi:predicted acylesterase/phospholipase RssA
MYICFSSGGINGLVHVGAWRVMEAIALKQGTWLHTRIKGASGASVGSLIALAMVLGYSSEEFEQLATEALSDTAVHKAAKEQYKGLININVISDFAKTMLHHKTGNPDMTFGELYKRGCAATGKRLTMSVHNLTTLQGEMFGTGLTDDCEVWRAVSMSCSLPIVFGSMMYKGCEYTDGGLSNALPLDDELLEQTIAVRIVKTPNAFGSHGSVLSHVGRIIEAYGTATQVRLETQKSKLLAYIEVVVDTPTIFKFVTSGGTLSLSEAEQRQQIHLGLMAALKTLHPDIALIISAVQRAMCDGKSVISAQCPRGVEGSVKAKKLTHMTLP